MKMLWDLVRSIPDFVNGLLIGFVRRMHSPTEVGPPERVACMRCTVPWPCPEYLKTLPEENQP